jgi:hypothetical protein
MTTTEWTFDDALAVCLRSASVDSDKDAVTKCLNDLCGWHDAFPSKAWPHFWASTPAVPEGPAILAQLVVPTEATLPLYKAMVDAMAYARQERVRIPHDSSPEIHRNWNARDIMYKVPGMVDALCGYLAAAKWPLNDIESTLTSFSHHQAMFVMYIIRACTGRELTGIPSSVCPLLAPDVGDGAVRLVAHAMGVIADDVFPPEPRPLPVADVLFSVLFHSIDRRLAKSIVSAGALLEHFCGDKAICPRLEEKMATL